jgi:two-component system KDP operon response regulator KdpE
LESHGYCLLEAETGQAGLDLVADEHPDLVLLDLGLPDTDGLTVIRRLRGWSQVPLIVISARGREADKVKALDGGADDYLTKPFSVVELQARMRVALRHVSQDQEEAGQPIFSLGNLRVDLERRQVFVAEKEIHLTPIEFRILATLIRHSGKVVTHRQLLKEVWGPDSIFENHYLRVYMTHLRRKIESNPAQPQFILTDPGIGYRLAM